MVPNRSADTKQHSLLLRPLSENTLHTKIYVYTHLHYVKPFQAHCNNLLMVHQQLFIKNPFVYEVWAYPVLCT